MLMAKWLKFMTCFQERTCSKSNISKYQWCNLCYILKACKINILIKISRHLPWFLVSWGKCFFSIFFTIFWFLFNLKFFFPYSCHFYKKYLSNFPSHTKMHNFKTLWFRRAKTVLYFCFISYWNINAYFQELTF